MQKGGKMEKLEYRKNDRISGAYGPGETLQTIMAEKYIKVSDSKIPLEGPCFDREGNLYFTSTAGFSVFKLDMDTKKIETVFYQEGIRPAAVKIHKDGRLFCACLTNEDLGGVFCMDPDGSNMKWVVRGYCVDDMVFDDEGGFYFNDMTGNARNPIGGIYYMAPDFKSVKCFCPHMSMPNGLALSPDKKVLWATEMLALRLHRFDLAPGRGGELSTIPYRFTGYLGPDSCEVDSDNNLYIAMPEQGQVFVVNRYGSPIGRILMPGREEGHFLFTTHTMIRPGTREIYITSTDPDDGPWILRAGAFAEADMTMYQFR